MTRTQGRALGTGVFLVAVTAALGTTALAAADARWTVTTTATVEGRAGVWPTASSIEGQRRAAVPKVVEAPKKPQQPAQAPDTPAETDPAPQPSQGSAEPPETPTSDPNPSDSPSPSNPASETPAAT